MTEDPWRSLTTPREAGMLTARRVSESSQWNFFWALDSEGAALLLLRYAAGAAPRERCPKLRGVDVMLLSDSDASGPALVLRLRDPSLRDLFAKLCDDILTSTRSATTEIEAAATALARTWRWHYLLRGSGDGLLSLEEQKGLIGELLVLEGYFLETVPASAAVLAWRGPLGESRDFLMQHLAVESKAVSSSPASLVRISSEYQLDDIPFGAAFLHISNVEPVRDEAEEGVTVSDVVNRVRERVHAEDVGACSRFDALLLAAGYRMQDDYSGTRWSASLRAIYSVHGNFPRVQSTSLRSGLADVQYSLAVSACAEFIVSADVLVAAIRQDDQ